MDNTAAPDLGIAPGSNAPAPPQTDAAVARAELERLKADPDFQKRHVGGSHETKDQVDKLIARMHAPTPGSVAMGAASAQAQRDEVADYLAENGPGLSPAHIAEIRAGTPNSPEVYRAAVAMKKSLMADPSWVARYMSNEHEARQQMMLINIIEANPVSLGK